MADELVVVHVARVDFSTQQRLGGILNEFFSSKKPLAVRYVVDSSATYKFDNANNASAFRERLASEGIEAGLFSGAAYDELTILKKRVIG